MLPDKLSDAIDRTLIDFALVRDDARYVFDMAYWHEPVGGVTRVSFAGCLLAKTLRATPGKTAYPREYGFGVARKLLAVDYLSRGWFVDAIEAAGLQATPGRLATCTIPDPRQDLTAFIQTLKELADSLRANGK